MIETFNYLFYIYLSGQPTHASLLQKVNSDAVLQTGISGARLLVPVSNEESICSPLSSLLQVLSSLTRLPMPIAYTWV